MIRAVMQDPDRSCRVEAALRLPGLDQSHRFEFHDGQRIGIRLGFRQFAELFLAKPRLPHQLEQGDRLLGIRARCWTAR